ncbi:hypothetical protein SAMN05421743_12837 [Thalassobacillus cyri]|uniref:Uncharacterized protein n=1 Tax=Thalassobacillus cyri TaxID=571932 RepID=A0A1H4HFN7_9BACI|nr:hypothetical protein [Thalassobacillus cyri]SEB20653.1 hypothetical protein SAMN05421743_12837 [Thalassobacillus cyri]
MWPILGVVLVAAAIFFIEAPKLIKENKKKELGYFCFFLFAATMVSLIESMGKEPPNPLDLIQAFYAPVNTWLQNTLYK